MLFGKRGPYPNKVRTTSEQRVNKTPAAFPTQHGAKVEKSVLLFLFISNPPLLLTKTDFPKQRFPYTANG
jgi:hypothetical protein